MTLFITVYLSLFVMFNLQAIQTSNCIKLLLQSQEQQSQLGRGRDVTLNGSNANLEKKSGEIPQLQLAATVPSATHLKLERTNREIHVAYVQKTSNCNAWCQLMSRRSRVKAYRRPEPNKKTTWKLCNAPKLWCVNWCQLVARLENENCSVGFDPESTLS